MTELALFVADPNTRDRCNATGGYVDSSDCSVGDHEADSSLGSLRVDEGAAVVDKLDRRLLLKRDEKVPQGHSDPYATIPVKPIF